ncbi:MAG: META domain-containing protein [Woeseiaceae bacterium]
MITLMSTAFVGACSSPDQESVPQHSPAKVLELAGTSWQIDDIDGGGVIDASNVTLVFPEDGKVVGSAGCNRYFGSVQVDGSTVSFGEAGATMMACPEELMNQERRFFDAIGSIVRGEVDSDGRLMLFDEMDQRKIRAVPQEPTESVASSEQPESMDIASGDGFSFDCGSAGTADVRFLGPDSVELSLAGKSYVLLHERAASGAKYVADGVVFWNKGDEALIEIGEKPLSCTRIRA